MLENTIADLNLRNHKLGHLLHTNKTVSITQLSLKRRVPVHVEMLKPNGSKVLIASNMVRDYEALGLSVRRTHE